MGGEGGGGGRETGGGGGGGGGEIREGAREGRCEGRGRQGRNEGGMGCEGVMREE